MICQYDVRHSPAGLARVPKVVLTGSAANGLAALIDDLPPVRFYPSSCPVEPGHYSQLIRFAYDGGRIRSAVSLAAAEGTARRHGLWVSLAGVVTDTRVPFGTVIFQALPPGSRSRLRNGPQVVVVVAARPAPACAAPQLRATYRSAAAIRGSDFGAVVIRDIGRAPCTLSGLIRIQGIGATGRPVTNAFRSRLPAAVTLGPNAAPIPDNAPSPNVIPQPPAELAGAIWLAAVYRIAPNSPAGTLCRPHWIVPTAWRVTLPGNLSVTVSNADPGGPDPIVASGSFVTCEGRLSYASLIYAGQPLS